MENFIPIWNFIVEWYWVPLLLVNATAFVTILVENGKPEKTIAWLLVIIFLPVIGVLLYYFFGQKFKKEKYFKVLDKKYHIKIEETWEEQKQFIEHQIDMTEKYDSHLNDAFEYLVHTRSSIPTSNNKIDLLFNGEQKFLPLLEDLKNAKHHIHIEYYIFDEDHIGKQVLDILVEKAKQNVEVRLIVDDFGSSKFAKKQKYYSDLGVAFEIFLPVRFSSLANSNYRNHRKIIVIDGEIGYVGGINISDRYINPNRFNLYWRDTSIRIHGDAVKMLQMQFWLHWQSISQNTFDLTESYFPTLKVKYDDLLTTFAFSSPGRSIPYVMEAMILSILSAKKSVDLCTPYFIPTESFKTALLATISKGIKVRLLLPDQGDSAIVQAASLSFLKPFMERGLEVYLYKKGFVHAKTVCIDGLLSYIGTTNLDSRSFIINFELSAIILNENIAQQLTQQFEKDLQDSYLFKLEYWTSKPWYYRSFASLCRLMAPLL